MSFKEPFGTIFAKWPQNYQKSIRFSLKVDDVSRPRKTVKFQCSLRVLAHEKPLFRIYERNILGPPQIINYPDRGPELGSSI